MKRLFLLTVILTGCLAVSAQEARPIAITAHRGHWTALNAGRAQNSVAALREAQRIGCWGSELDVHLSADGIVVVNHDDPVRHLSPSMLLFSSVPVLRFGWLQWLFL